ncbi:TerD family protein [Kitasatospora gansuensis]
MLLPGRSRSTCCPGRTCCCRGGGLAELSVRFDAGGPEADLTLLLLTGAGVVRNDEDFVFYHQPTDPDGAVTLRPKEPADGRRSETATVRLPGLPAGIERVAVSVNMDADSTATCAELLTPELTVRAADGSAWAFRPPADPEVAAMLVAELYRHQGSWKLRAVGQGWSDGLAGLARAHGVQIA